MKVLELLAVLAERNVRLWVEGDQLRYRAPKGVLISELRDSLLQHKDEVIGILRQRARESISLYPLSYGQKALWFINQAMPESASYHVAFPVRIRSKVNVPALKRVFQALMDRHPMLRTTYADENGVPVQQVHGHMQLSFSETDASYWSEEELNEQVTEAYRHPFDLKRGPLFRIHTFSRSELDHIFLMVAHHIAVDGWSVWLLLDEMRSLYSSQINGEPASIPIPEADYTDYVRWQAEMLSGGEGERLWAYWKRQLEGELAPLDLPGYRSRMPVQRFRGASHVFAINERLTDQIKSFAKAEGVTLYTFLLGTYLALLYRYSDQQDILVSSPVAGRSKPEFARIVGCFVNPVVLRARVSGDMTFRQLLSQTHKTVLGALDHQDYPLSLLTERLQPTRNLSRSPLFQVDFALQKPQQSDDISAIFGTGIEVPRINFGALELEPFYMSQQEGQLDLTLEMAEGKGLFWGSFKYNTDLFDAPAIDRMAGHFRMLLESVVSEPAQGIAALRILPDEERHQLLVAWNGTRSECADLLSKKELCIHQLFEREVDRAPDAPALAFDGEQITYRELNEKANQLAHYLRSKGVGRETLVGIYIERSMDLVISVLAVLKAGGCYLPLDPSYPKQRLEFMLEDTKAPVLVTHGSVAADITSHVAQHVYLDADHESIRRESDENPVSQATPESLAYVIYTSGSTGQAKGVMIQHNSLVNAYLGWEEAYKLRSLSSHLQMASFSFDVFAGDFIRALCSGGKLVLCPRDYLMDPKQLHKLMCEERVDCAEFVPVVLRQLTEYLERSEKRLDFLKILICGSDKWYMNEYDSLTHLCGSHTRFINSYGVTEATIDSSYFENANLDSSNEQSVPIGRPFANVQLYILDKNLQLTPIGVPGELHIGGPGLARGYLNRPELTAEKFIINPFCCQPDARVYKTGDLARWLPDGNIELLDRVDFQVKIRGFRVEVGEIESILGQHPAVRQNAVTAIEDEFGSKRIVAYVVTNHQSMPSVANELRSFLKEKLPDYMLPSSFVLMEELPLTPNGKVDRRALPTPDNLRPDLESAYVSPRNELEEAIASVWQAVLNLEKVGIHDNFFELGGHSLLATQLVSRFRQALGTEVPLRSLFEATTVASQAELIDALRWTSQNRQSAGDMTGDEREVIEI